MHVTILGGGACGMMAAWELCRRGVRVTLLEREERPGGLCGTVEDGGFHFDYGGHRVISQNRELVQRLEALMGSEFLRRVRSSVILYRGQQFSYPLRAEEVLRQIPPAEAAAAWFSYTTEALRRRVHPAPDHSFEDWVVHRFGRVLYDIFFGPYTEKLWGLPPSQISSDWASQRISLLHLTDVALRMAGLRRGGARTHARRYLYPRRGIGQLFGRMAEEICALGGEIRYGVEVCGLDMEDLQAGRARVRAVRFIQAGQGGREEVIDTDQVISTLALPRAVQMVASARSLQGPGAADAQRAAGRLRFRGVRFLNVKLDRPRFSPHTWLYVSEPRYLATRIQEPSHRSPFAAPPGKTSIMLEVPCQVGGAVWTLPTDALYERCMVDLEALGFPGVERDTLGYFSTYVAEGYPVYHHGYDEDRRVALGFLGRVENLTSCGRQGSFRYVFMDTAMEMGMLAAARAAQGRSATLEVAGLRSERGLIEARAVAA
jgi:protoporphyrinogen oxidase